MQRLVVQKSQYVAPGTWKAGPRRAPEPRSERIEVRVPPSLHERVTQAAALRGQTLAAFVTAAVNNAALQALEDAEVTRLNAADFDALMTALDAVTEPHAALKAAASRYRARM